LPLPLKVDVYFMVGGKHSRLKFFLLHFDAVSLFRLNGMPINIMLMKTMLLLLCDK